MILFTILACILLIFIVVMALMTIVGGVGLVVIFSDVFVCVILIVLIVKYIIKCKKK